MDIHEYQAKEILSEFGVPVPRGGLAYSPEQAAYRAREIGGERVGRRILSVSEDQLHRFRTREAHAGRPRHPHFGGDQCGDSLRQADEHG